MLYVYYLLHELKKSAYFESTANNPCRTKQIFFKVKNIDRYILPCRKEFHLNLKLRFGIEFSAP